MENYRIIKIEFTETNGEREVHVFLDNGTIVKIVLCYESWEQYNATTPELSHTIDVADAVNDWLHGGEEPDVTEFIETNLLPGNCLPDDIMASLAQKHGKTVGKASAMYSFMEYIKSKSTDYSEKDDLIDFVENEAFNDFYHECAYYGVSGNVYDSIEGTDEIESLTKDIVEQIKNC